MGGETSTWLPGLLIPLFMIGFALFWSFIMMVIASMGWNKFSSRQTSDVQLPIGSERISFGSMNIGDSMFASASYGACMNFYVDPSGLFLRPFFMFRLFHPTLRFAWNDIHSVTVKKQFLARYYRLDFGPSLPPMLILDGFALKAGSRIEQAWRQYSSNAARQSLQPSPGQRPI